MEQKTPSDELQVIAVAEQLTKGMIARNTANMDKIVDEKFTLTHMTGYVQPKKEWFAEIEKEGMKYYSAKNVNHTTNINGDSASFLTQDLVDARIWGTRHTWRLQQRMQLQKRGGKWIILNSVASTF